MTSAIEQMKWERVRRKFPPPSRPPPAPDSEAHQRFGIAGRSLPPSRSLWAGRLGILILQLLSTAVLEAQHPSRLQFPPLEFHPPRVERRVLSNGIVLFALENHELPTFEMELWVRAGSQYDPVEKIGLSDLFAEVHRDGGTLARTPEELNRALESMPASIESWVSDEAAGVRCSCLVRDLDRTLDLFTDVLLHPAFREDKLRQRKQEAIEGIRRRDDQPGGVADRELSLALYGPRHPSGWKSEVETLEAVTAQDIRRYHEAFFTPRGAVLAAAGDFESDRLAERLEKLLGGWGAAEASLPELPIVEGDTARSVYLVHKAITQSHIRIGHLGVRRHNPDRFALIVLNEILGGGGFTSRFVREIRSRRGLAYSVWSYFTEERDRGRIVAGGETKAESTSETVSLMLQILAEVREETVSSEELDTAKDSILNSFVFRFDSVSKIAKQRLHLFYYGFPDDYLETYAEKMRSVTREDVLRVARTYLHPEQAVILVVGNPEKFDRPLDAFGPVQTVTLRDPGAWP